MFNRAADRKIKFRLNALADQQPVSPSIDTSQRAFAACIQSLMLVLGASPTGRALLQSAAACNVSVGLDFLLEPSSSFFYPAQPHLDFGYQPELLQKTGKGQGRYLACLIGGLRRAWHHLHGCAPDVSLRPMDFLRQFRTAEADIESITHLVAWELRAAGHAALWRHLLSGVNGDVAVVFERVASDDPAAQFDGGALKAVFNQWFAEHERVDACDHQALEILDMALLEGGEKTGSRALRPEQLRPIGRLPQGGNYLAFCQFSGDWYENMNSTFNHDHLRHIERDISQLAANKENIDR